MVPKLTTNGIGLMVRAMAGEGIVFTKISIGNGDVPRDFTELTTLQNELVGMGIDEIITEEQYVIVKAHMTNADFEAGFYWTELGVYAKDPDGGDDILYAYAHYAITGDEAATYIPASDSSLVEITHSVHVFVGELDNVTAMLTKHSEYASAADLKEHTENTKNPHKVTKEQVGLGLIQNALPEDQKPTFSTAPSSYTHNSTANTWSFANIFSGESVGNILRKVRTIISLVIDHFNASNPHRVTAEQAGAAKKNHRATSTEYGMANATYFGHAKLSDETDSTNSASDGYAASPKAVKAAYDLANFACSATGIYSGEGRCGKNNPNKITFEKGLPKAVLVAEIRASPASTRHGTFILHGDYASGYSVCDGYEAALTVSVKDNTLQWYYNTTEYHPANQLDTPNAVFVWAAIY